MAHTRPQQQVGMALPAISSPVLLRCTLPLVSYCFPSAKSCPPEKSLNNPSVQTYGKETCAGVGLYFPRIHGHLVHHSNLRLLLVWTADSREVSICTSAGFGQEEVRTQSIPMRIRRPRPCAALYIRRFCIERCSRDTPRNSWLSPRFTLVT